MEKKGVDRIKSITTKTLSDFIRLEEGSTGKQNALKAGAAIGGSVLAQVLLAAVESADAKSHSSGLFNTSHASTSLWIYHSSAL